MSRSLSQARREDAERQPVIEGVEGGGLAVVKVTACYANVPIYLTVGHRKYFISSTRSSSSRPDSRLNTPVSQIGGSKLAVASLACFRQHVRQGRPNLDYHVLARVKFT